LTLTDSIRGVLYFAWFSLFGISSVDFVDELNEIVQKLLVAVAYLLFFEEHLDFAHQVLLNPTTGFRIMYFLCLVTTIVSLINTTILPLTDTTILSLTDTTIVDFTDTAILVLSIITTTISFVCVMAVAIFEGFSEVVFIGEVFLDDWLAALVDDDLHPFDVLPKTIILGL